jgi:hypothetical protein
MLQVTPKNRLAKIRRQAKKRGLRVLCDRCGNFTVVSTSTEPPRPLHGLDHVPLWVIEQVITTPLPEPPPRRPRMTRLTEPTPTVQAAAPAKAEAPVRAQAHHSFLSLVEALKAQGGAP